MSDQPHTTPRKETARWEPVKAMMQGGSALNFGDVISYQFRHSPRRILFAMSYYKFAAKMIGKKQRVLEVGCGEGLGTWLLAKECGQAKGLDFDQEAILKAQENWREDNLCFECADFLSSNTKERYGGVVSLDVIEHIRPDHASDFLNRMAEVLDPYGVAIVGTPNITSDRYASEVTRKGHINLYNHQRLEDEMRKHFSQVFMFAANDEVIHTGFFPMAHYLIALGCKG